MFLTLRHDPPTRIQKIHLLNCEYQNLNNSHRMEYVLEGYGNHPTLRKYSVEYLKGKNVCSFTWKILAFLDHIHTSPLPEWPYTGNIILFLRIALKYKWWWSDVRSRKYTHVWIWETIRIKKYLSDHSRFRLFSFTIH